MKFLYIIIFLSFTNSLLAQESIVASKTEGCVPMTVNFSHQLNNVKSLQWNFSNGMVSTQFDPVILFDQVGSFNVGLSVIYNNDQSETITFSKPINVIDKPDVQFTTAGNDFCNQQEINFTNSTTGAVRYLWDFGDGSTSALTEPTHSYENEGSYSITLIAYNEYDCPGVKIISDAIQISKVEGLDFNANLKATCLEDATVTFSSSNEFSSLLWDFGDGMQSPEASPIHTYSQAGKYDVSLTVTDDNGCEASLTKNNFVEIYEQPIMDISVSESIVCIDGIVSFTNKTPNAISIYWLFSDGFSSTEESFTRQFSTAGIYSLDVTVTNSNECTTTSTFSNAVEVINANSPTIQISDMEGCVPFKASFNNTTADATSSVWEINGLTFSENNVEYTFLTSGVYPISVKTTHTSGCVSTLEYDQNIVVHDSEIEIYNEERSGCIPFETSFDLSNTNVSDIKWDFGNGTTSNDISPTAEYYSPGVYEVNATFVNQYGCLDSITFEKPVIAVDTLINYTAPDPIYACNTIEVYFTGEMGKDFWLWDFGDGTTSNIVNPTHIYDKPGTYDISLVTNNYNGCKTSIQNYNKVRVSDVEIDFATTLLDGALCPSFSIQFENLSDHTDIFWDFGDGSTSATLDPIHDYTGTSQFTATLTATDTLGCTKTKATIITPPWPYCEIPDEEGDLPDSVINVIQYHTIRSCIAPFEIDFTNPKPDAIEWRWDFGDGTSSQTKNPTHIFENQGKYLVDLIYTDSIGETDSILGYTTVHIEDALIDFNYIVETNCTSSKVKFFNTNNTLANWQWNFGNGKISNDEDPEEEYAFDAVYQVSLNATDSAGCLGKTVKNIVVGNPYKKFTYPSNICLGDPINIDHNIQFYVNYDWDFGDGTIKTAKYPNHTYSKGGEYEITLKVTGQDGCLEIFKLPYKVSVNHPKANFDIVNSKQKHGCNYLTTRFRNISHDADTWQWDFGNGITSDEENPIIEFSPGSFSVELVASKNGCYDTIKYEDLIVVDSISTDFSFSQDQICLPVTITFNDISNGADEWLWDFGDGNQSTERNPIHVYETNPTSEVTLSVKNTSGCESKISKSLNTFFTSDFAVSKQQVCIPEELTFTSNTKDAKYWFWDLGDGSTLSGETVNHVYTLPGEYTIKLITQSVSGCYDTLIHENMVSAMEVSAKFKADTADGSCAPLLVDFVNESSGATKYQWSFGDDATSSNENPFHVYTKVGDFDVKLIASNDYGCKSEFLINELVSTNGPQAKISFSDSVVCDPTLIKFMDMSVSAVKREWFFGDGTSSSEENPEYQYNGPGNYTVSLLATDTLGCVEIVKYDPIKVYPIPKASFDVADYDQCLPVNIDLINNSEKLQNESYIWDFGNNSASTSDTPSAQYSNPGSYTVSLTVTNEATCSDTYVYETEILVMDTAQILEPRVFELSVLDDNKIDLINEAYMKNNFKYHVVYRADDLEQKYDIIDTLWQATDTTFLDKEVSTDKMSYSYQIKTYAYCQKDEEESSISTYKSIKLNVEAKEEGIKTNWTSYIGHTFDHYVVCRRGEDDNVWKRIGVVDPSQTEYIDTEDLCSGKYSYKVIAENLNAMNHHSNSNDITVEPYIDVFELQKVEIVRSTVENAAVFTEWKQPEIGPDKVVYYRIWRSEDKQNYELVDQVPKGVTNFYDDAIDVSLNNYYYMVDIVNTCDIQGKESGLGASILLQKETEDYTNRIFWNPYKEWPDGVSKYLIQRKDEFGVWQTIEMVPSSQKEFIIDLNKD